MSPQRFFNWRRRGIPVAQVRHLSKALSGALLPHQLRPDLPEIFPAESDAQIQAA
ncbi:helix-turn-helix domain-containing protein [Pseudomonas fluorescens]|uniref:helix-turn-helix domain-containing protein n=1 Tax=Pseudomonas sp. FP1762 TaxID=2954080 RepID=UPI001CD67537